MRLQLKTPLGLLGLVVLVATSARADEVTGTWTGNVELRGNYYWERSTRVIAPAARLRLDAPNGTELHAGYLVDTITSASQAFGALVDRRFTEIRHDFDIGASHEWDLPREGDTFRLGGSVRHSFEDDYQSYGAGVNGALSFDEDATVFRLNLNVLHDIARQQFRGADRSAGGRDLSDRGVIGELDAVVIGGAWDQILSPVLVSSLGYEIAYLDGYQANPYRLVPVGPTPMMERHPETRLRHTATGRLAYYIRPTGTALHAMMRIYSDDWDIDAVTPEGRIYQELGPSTQVRLRYRYYQQTQASFAPPDGGYPEDAAYFTADPKMTAFHSHLLGFAGSLRLDGLAGSSLDFASRATFELSFDYLWNTNRYGNAVIAQAALRSEF